VIAVGDVMPGALAQILRAAPLTPEKVAFAWRSAVGSSIEKATTIDLRDGVLHVVARDRAWQREVERGMVTIRARLDALLGDAVVRDVSVSVPPGPRWEGGSGIGRRGR
jgi:hypothetical protein